MSQRFEYFVICAGMRTGSNFLESNLNSAEDVQCYGEAFNPHFVGYPNREDLFGIDLRARTQNPMALLQAIRDSDVALPGFRLFHDHDPQILAQALADPACAKIVLTRNPLDSYVSWKIAQATGQWKLTNVTKRKDQKASFDAEEFAEWQADQADFQDHILRVLQSSGQTGFPVRYDDLHDLDVLNGLLKWLGSDHRIEGLAKNLKRQNPAPVMEKVENPADMAKALAKQDPFALARSPFVEPLRGPQVPSFVTAAQQGLIYMPMRGGPETAVAAWLADLDNVPPEALGRGLSQADLRQWKRARPGHRSFTVIRHPLARAHAVFCQNILWPGPEAMMQVRRVLRRVHDLDIPEDGPDESYHRDQHRAVFATFLRFLRANLTGQTPLRVDARFASQAAALQGMAAFTLPDVIVREEEMRTVLPALARSVGHPSPPEPAHVPLKAPFALAEIYDADLEALAQDVYQRDYLMFGFEDWT